MKKWNKFWGVRAAATLEFLLSSHFFYPYTSFAVVVVFVVITTLKQRFFGNKKKRALLYARNLLLILLYLLLTRNFHVSRLLHRLQIIWTRKTTCFWFQQCDSKLNALTSNIVQHRETTQKKKNIKALKTEKDTFLIYVWNLNVSHVSCFPRRQERWRFGIANFYTSFSSSRRHCFSCMRNFTFKLVDRRANFKVFGNAEG